MPLAALGTAGSVRAPQKGEVVWRGSGAVYRGPHVALPAPCTLAATQQPTLFTVVQSVPSGSPARSAACREGAWPKLALRGGGGGGPGSG